MAEKFPEVTERLKKYLAAGKVELIGGTYGQPMGTTIGGESNIRQIVVGREMIRKTLDYEMTTFLEEEEFTHPQVPQLCRAGRLPLRQPGPAGHVGPGGLPADRPQRLAVEGDRRHGDPLACPRTRCSATRPTRRKLAGLGGVSEARRAGQAAGLRLGGVRLGVARGARAYLTAPAKYQELAKRRSSSRSRSTSTSTAGSPRRPIYLPMDAWNKSLTWGLGGDQVRGPRPQGGRAAPGGGAVRRRGRRAGRAAAGRARWKRPGATCWPRRATTWACASIPAGRTTAWRRWSGSKTSTISLGERSATTTWTRPRSRARRCSMPPWATSPAGSTRPPATAKHGQLAVTSSIPSGWQRSEVGGHGADLPLAGG